MQQIQWRHCSRHDNKVLHFRLSPCQPWSPFWEHPAALAHERSCRRDIVDLDFKLLEKTGIAGAGVTPSMGWFACQFLLKQGFSLVSVEAEASA